MRAIVAIAFAGAWFALSCADAQIVDTPLPDPDASRIVRTITRFHTALYRRNVEELKTLCAAQGVYVSWARQVVDPAHIGASLDGGSSLTREDLDEKTVPATRIDLIHEITPDVRLVHYCQVQPSLMTPGKSTEVVAVREGQQWRVAAISITGTCQP